MVNTPAPTAVTVPAVADQTFIRTLIRADGTRREPLAELLRPDPGRHHADG